MCGDFIISIDYILPTANASRSWEGCTLLPKTVLPPWAHRQCAVLRRQLHLSNCFFCMGDRVFSIPSLEILIAIPAGEQVVILNSQKALRVARGVHTVEETHWTEGQASKLAAQTRVRNRANTHSGLEQMRKSVALSPHFSHV